MAKVNIGLRQAKRLCQLPKKERFRLIGEGLPIILESARGFWRASGQLADYCPREADVLEGFAEEEAAKILILMDAVRCPSKLIAERIRDIIHNFYDHLARRLYAEAQGWQPMHVAQLQEYLNTERKAHYLEGTQANTWFLTGLYFHARASFTRGRQYRKLMATGPRWHGRWERHSGHRRARRDFWKQAALVVLGIYSELRRRPSI